MQALLHKGHQSRLRDTRRDAPLAGDARDQYLHAMVQSGGRTLLPTRGDMCIVTGPMSELVLGFYSFPDLMIERGPDMRTEFNSQIL